MTRWRGLAMAALVTGCSSLPITRIYVLGDPPALAIGVRSEAGLVVIVLRTVSVPDYLDTTDILRRSGPNEVIPSPTGRWGERLSLGLTDALASALSGRLPQLVITTIPAAEPTRRLFVDVDRADIGIDGSCLVAARWRVTGIDGKTMAASSHGTFGETAASSDDSAVASAMTKVIGRLAEQVAATIEAGGR